MTVRGAIGTALFGVVVSAIGAGCSAAAPDAMENEATDSTSQAICKDPPCVAVKEPPIRVRPPIDFGGVVAVTPSPVSCSTMDHGGDGIAKATAEGGSFQNPGYFSAGPQVYKNDIQYPYAATGNCVNADVDALTTAERQLMGYGCSFPFYWEAWDDSSGTNPSITPPLADCATNERWGCFSVETNAIVMLCPMTSATSSYIEGSSISGNNECSDNVGGLGCTTYRGQVSDLRAHWAVNGNVATHGTNPPGKFFDTLIPSPPSGYGWVSLWEDPLACSGGSCMCRM